MLSFPINTIQSKPLTDRILQDYGLVVEDMVFCNSPYEYAISNSTNPNSLREEDRRRIALTISVQIEGTLKRVILLKNIVVKEDYDLVTRGIEARIRFSDITGFSPAQLALNTKDKFIKHTLLHEIWHYNNDPTTEKKADVFAFREMRINVDEE